MLVTEVYVGEGVQVASRQEDGPVSISIIYLSCMMSRIFGCSCLRVFFGVSPRFFHLLNAQVSISSRL